MAESQSEKLHAACDECRTRKLKCSGHHPACSRCEREKIQCYYSPQKPMGRPRKRRRDITTEQTQLDQITAIERVYKSPAIDSFEIPAFNELSIPSSFENFTGLENFQTNDRLGSALLPPSYSETTRNDGFEHENTQTTNFDPNATHTTIDPSLWNDQQKDHPTPRNLPINTSEPLITSSQPTPNIGPCTCFSLMYLTVSDLHSITNFSFPAVVPRLRNAATAAQSIIKCPTCLLSPFSAIQNVQSLNSILSSLAERYHKVLIEIDAETARLEAIDQKKAFRFGDNSPENATLHTGTLDCPMGFDIELPPRDWRRLCKAALRQEVHGGGHTPVPLVKLLDEFAERQIKLHNDNYMMSETRERIYGRQDGCKDADNFMCMRMLTQLRTMVENMKWDD